MAKETEETETCKFDLSNMFPHTREGLVPIEERQAETAYNQRRKEIYNLVDRFAARMKKKMEPHIAHRDFHQVAHRGYFMQRFWDEVMEFVTVYQRTRRGEPGPTKRQAVTDEAADVANFLMFICHESGDL